MLDHRPALVDGEMLEGDLLQELAEEIEDFGLVSAGEGDAHLGLPIAMAIERAAKPRATKPKIVLSSMGDLIIPYYKGFWWRSQE